MYKVHFKTLSHSDPEASNIFPTFSITLTLTLYLTLYLNPPAAAAAAAAARLNPEFDALLLRRSDPDAGSGFRGVDAPPMAALTDETVGGRVPVQWTDAAALKVRCSARVLPGARVGQLGLRWAPGQPHIHPTLTPNLSPQP